MTDYEQQQRLRDITERKHNLRILRLGQIETRERVGADHFFAHLLISCRKRRNDAILKANRLINCA